ncbi:MAG: DUF4097 family beta strand repeat-containing protein [Acidobacteriota bacterium]
MIYIFRISIAALLGACIVSASDSATFDRTLTVSGPVDLDVRSDAGGIIITTGSGSSIRVHAVIKPLLGRFDLDLAEANIRALVQNPPIEQTGNHIRMGYVKDPGLLRGVTMRLEIETPRTTQVRAHTESGGIRIDGVEGPVDAQTASGRTEISSVATAVKVSGDSGAIVILSAGQVSLRNQSGSIRLQEIRGTVNSETSSGATDMSSVSGDIHATTRSSSIRIDDVKGSLVVNTASGRIDAFRVAGSVHAETKSGAIKIAQVAAAPLRALSDTGEIQVELSSGGGYLIDALSNSGKVSGPLPEEPGHKGERHRMQGPVGGGGPLVDLDTRSSKITIH